MFPRIGYEHTADTMYSYPTPGGVGSRLSLDFDIDTFLDSVFEEFYPIKYE